LTANGWWATLIIDSGNVLVLAYKEWVWGNLGNLGGVMKKIRLGKTEMMATKLGFGGIPIQRVSEDEAIAVVKRCLDLGINFIDTANLYSNSEERIGKAISGRREGLILATKSRSRTREGVESHLRQSLRKLGVQSIDLYQLHDVSSFEALDEVLDPNGPIAVVEEAKRAGLVKHIGITSHLMDVAKEAIKSDRFETIMFPFNIITCEPADELLPLAREHDVGFIAMKPLEGGTLDNITIAFKYLFQFPDVISIPGMQKVQEVEEIVQILEGPQTMSETEQREVERLRQELGTMFCRRCEYCQPCPENIHIAQVMTANGIYRSQPLESFFSRDPAAKEVEEAANCTKCGDCEERCPYHLPIREMMEENYNLYLAEKGKYHLES